MNIDQASQELGKSLAKIMVSEKYAEFSNQQIIMILTNARNNAIDILIHEAGGRDPNFEYTRGENQN